MKITRSISLTGQHEAFIRLHWFARTGSYTVSAVGLGNSPEAAETSARLMLGQARAELSKATTEEVA